MWSNICECGNYIVVMYSHEVNRYNGSHLMSDNAMAKLYFSYRPLTFVAPVTHCGVEPFSFSTDYVLGLWFYILLNRPLNELRNFLFWC